MIVPDHCSEACWQKLHRVFSVKSSLTLLELSIKYI